jgi:large subunit ribosomal protein L24
MKIKQGDKIMVISGKYKGKTGTVMRTYEKLQKVTVEKINIRTRHIKKTASGPGQRLQYEAPFSISNVMLICPACSKVARVGYKVTEKGNVRICKKCKKSVDQAIAPKTESKSKKK